MDEVTRKQWLQLFGMVGLILMIAAIGLFAPPLELKLKPAKAGLADQPTTASSILEELGYGTAQSIVWSSTQIFGTAYAEEAMAVTPGGSAQLVIPFGMVLHIQTSGGKCSCAITMAKSSEITFGDYNTENRCNILDANSTNDGAGFCLDVARDGGEDFVRVECDTLRKTPGARTSLCSVAAQQSPGIGSVRRPCDDDTDCPTGEGTCVAVDAATMCEVGGGVPDCQCDTNNTVMSQDVRK